MLGLVGFTIQDIWITLLLNVLIQVCDVGLLKIFDTVTKSPINRLTLKIVNHFNIPSTFSTLIGTAKH